MKCFLLYSTCHKINNCDYCTSGNVASMFTADVTNLFSSSRTLAAIFGGLAPRTRFHGSCADVCVVFQMLNIIFDCFQGMFWYRIKVNRGSLLRGSLCWVPLFYVLLRSWIFFEVIFARNYFSLTVIATRTRTRQIKKPCSWEGVNRYNCLLIKSPALSTAFYVSLTHIHIYFSVHNDKAVPIGNIYKTNSLRQVDYLFISFACDL